MYVHGGQFEVTSLSVLLNKSKRVKKEKKKELTCTCRGRIMVP